MIMALGKKKQKVVHSFFSSRNETNAEYTSKEAGIFKEKILEISSKYNLAANFKRNNFP